MINLNPHQIEDLELYFCFLLGQITFVMKRAASAIRNPEVLIRTRRAYIAANWDNILIRLVFETSTIFYLARHYTIAQLLTHFGVDVSGSWASFIAAIPTSAFSLWGIGYASDSILDWVSQSPKVPSWIRRWIAENVPKF